MRPTYRIYEDFERKFEQPGYSATEISNAAPKEGKLVHADAIRRYVSENSDLAIDLKKARINLSGSNIGSLIPESKLAALMEGMEMGGTAEDLIRKLKHSRKVAASNPNQKNRASRKYR